ncbi:MAG: glycosyltransferase family A protein [Pseudoflavonifractor sp.]
MKMLTIFTPTYNRAHLLPKLYETLRQQTDKGFEWLVVDDGSADETPALFARWTAAENGFPIRYVRQENGGKHRAINRAVPLAHGDWFYIVDSDDYLPENAVALINRWTATITDPEGFAGVSGLKIHEDGSIFGGVPQVGERGYVDALNTQRKRYHLGSEKAEVYRTAVLARFPFPTYEGENFASEGILGNAISEAGLKIRWFAEPACVCEYWPDGLTAQGVNQREGHMKNPLGYLYMMRQQLRLGTLKNRIIAIHSYGEIGVALGKSKRQVAQDLGVPLPVCAGIDWGYKMRAAVLGKL